jgi:ATPase subunit of ABC transporter with duplicated ATPase domains
MMVLQMFELTKEYDGHAVLTGSSGYLTAGDRVGLVGANGCGKTTLLQILSGELRPDGGSLRWLVPGLTRAYVRQEGRTGPEEGPMSGGEKTRAALTRALAANPGVLLLDEPTNHLDADGLVWLESQLKTFRGAVLVVSHDRYFLDAVATRILELDGGKLKEYPGNYSAYARQKQLELETAREEYRQYAREKAHLEEAIRRQIQWASVAQNQKLPGELKLKKAENKAKGKAHMQTAKAMQGRLERMRVDKPRDAARINLRMDEGSGLGRNLILAENLGFTYDGRRWLFRGAGFYVQRGDKVAIVGPNGAGKSTLLKLLLGQMAPTEGRIHLAPMKVAYLAQEMETLNPANTVLEEATGGNSAADQAYARSLLGCLLFSGEDVLKRVAVLSGGEKVRLALAKILLSSPDLLVLDEPTNGLDLPSRERVEEALENYPGTLVLVSHDRYLLRRVANRVIAVGGGRIDVFGGGYQEWVDWRQQPAGSDDLAARRLLLETRLAQLSARLDDLKLAPPEKEQLNAEFLQVSRDLRSLRA